jgi:hypothetical protein
VNKNIFVRFHQNKCTLLNISLKSYCKKRHGIKNREKQKKEERKKRKKKKKIRKKEKKMRIKIAHDLTKTLHVPIREKYVSRSIIKFVCSSIHHITTHMHILI